MFTKFFFSFLSTWNNKLKGIMQKYQGVGGHLFAVAAELSFKRGYEGYVYGEENV